MNFPIPVNRSGVAASLIEAATKVEMYTTGTSPKLAEFPKIIDPRF